MNNENAVRGGEADNSYRGELVLIDLLNEYLGGADDVFAAK